MSVASPIQALVIEAMKKAWSQDEIVIMTVEQIVSRLVGQPGITGEAVQVRNALNLLHKKGIAIKDVRPNITPGRGGSARLAHWSLTSVLDNATKPNTNADDEDNTSLIIGDETPAPAAASNWKDILPMASGAPRKDSPEYALHEVNKRLTTLTGQLEKLISGAANRQPATPKVDLTKLENLLGGLAEKLHEIMDKDAGKSVALLNEMNDIISLIFQGQNNVKDAITELLEGLNRADDQQTKGFERGFKLGFEMGQKNTAPAAANATPDPEPSPVPNQRPRQVDITRLLGNSNG